jgi:hypothetical protein
VTTGGPGASARSARSRSRPVWWAYVWWLVVGALVGLGVAALLTIGAALLLLASVLVLVASRVPALRSPAVGGGLAGIGLAVFYLAWLNREGPGTVCHTTATSVDCTDEWSPWPFVAVGVALVLGSVLLVQLLRRRYPGSE